MKPDQPSRTALLPARHRAAHQLLEHGAILQDPFALAILGEDEQDVLRFATLHPLVGLMRLFTAARCRIAEDAASDAIGRGVRQIVILGAGLDTFALRHPHDARGIRVFEVDHPATQAWKRQRLAEAGLAIPSGLTFVPVDFEQDALQERLAGAGFQPDAPAFFTWLGVVPYLTEEAIGGTLDDMASIPNAEVVFDYMEPAGAFPEEFRDAMTKRTQMLGKTDEPWVSHFTPTDLAALLRAHGFPDIEDIGLPQIMSRFDSAVPGAAPVQAGLHVVHARRPARGPGEAARD